MLRILIPGWGIPLSFYAVLKPDVIFDHGFFPSDATYAETSGDAIEIFKPGVMGTAEDFELPDVPYEVVAHSLGAIVALSDSPLRNNAEKLIVIGGFAKFAESDDNPRGTPLADIDAMSDSVKTDPTKLLKRFHRLVAFPERFRFRPVPDTVDTEALLKGLELLKSCDIRGDLKSLRVPLTLLHGERDTVVSAELARDVASKVQTAPLTLIPDSGHALPFTKYHSLDLWGQA